MSGSVGIPTELGNQCFLGFLKEITLIASSLRSLQGADAIGCPQGLSLAPWGIQQTQAFVLLQDGTISALSHGMAMGSEWG